MPIRLVVFDVDGTLTTHNSSWWRLHEAFNTHLEGEKFYDQYFAGEIDYQEWADLDAGLWKGKPLSVVERIADETRLMPGAQETVKELKRNSLNVAILSGGIDLLANRVAQKLSIDYVMVNRILHKNGILTGEVDVRVGWGGKAQEIQQIIDDFHVSAHETAFIGDGRNDVSAFEVVGLSIAFNPEHNEVARAADEVVLRKDLREILKYILRE